MTRLSNVELWLSLEPNTRLVGVELGAKTTWLGTAWSPLPRELSDRCSCCDGEHSTETLDDQTRFAAVHVQVTTSEEGEPTVHDLWVCRECEAEFETEKQGLRNTVMLNELAKSLAIDRAAGL